MHTLKAVLLVCTAIAVWLIAPILGVLVGTVALIVIIRFILKEHADVQRNQHNNF